MENTTTNTFHKQFNNVDNFCKTYKKKTPFGRYFDNIFNTCLNMIKLAPQNEKNFI